MSYEDKRALPNKMLNEDGSITDLLGNPVVPTNEAYKKRPALPNKWLNPDGTYSTLTELIAGAIDTDVFVIVDELPAEGNPKKIYLVPDGEGGFNEYHYINGEWDPVGTIDMGVNPQVFYWDGNTQQAGLDFWNNIYQLQKTQPCLVYTTYTQNNKSITQHWLYNNNMPTSASETTVSYSVYTPSGMQMIDNSYSQISRYTCQLYFTIADDQVTAINMNTHSPSNISYIDATGYYPTAFIPSSPSSPATKKYVDDKTKPEVYYWDGKTDQTGLDFWTNIFEVNKIQSVCVIWKQPSSTSKGTYMGYLSVNELPTKKFLYGWLLTQSENQNLSYHSYYLQQALSFTYVNDVVTQITSNVILEMKMLDLASNYARPYEPLYPGSPTTKKYVDDKINETSVFLSYSAISDLTEESTMEEIYEAFGGEDFFKDMVFNKFANKASLYFYDNLNGEVEGMTSYAMYLTPAQYDVNSTSGYTFDIIIRSLVNRKQNRGALFGYYNR